MRAHGVGGAEGLVRRGVGGGGREEGGGEEGGGEDGGGGGGGGGAAPGGELEGRLEEGRVEQGRGGGVERAKGEREELAAQQLTQRAEAAVRLVEPAAAAALLDRPRGVGGGGGGGRVGGGGLGVVALDPSEGAAEGSLVPGAEPA